MPDDKSLEFERKARFDLWTHQNQLFWDRFKVLAVIQAAYFAAMNAVKTEPLFIWTTGAVTLYLMLILYNILETDRKLRNFNASELRKNFKFDPLPPSQTLPNLFSSIGLNPNRFEILFQVSIFFIIFVADAIVLWRSLQVSTP